MKLTNLYLARVLASAGIAATLFFSSTHTVMAITKDSTDPFLWLEDVEGDRALTWVRAQNERSLKQLTSDPRYERFNKAALAILEDKSRIPFGSLRDGWVYNFWQDDVNVRGLWRRTSRASYETQSPEWQTLLDLDALAKKEDRNWVWKGVSCVLPPGERCMVKLSNGGKDASVLREFDFAKREFVAGGFEVPEAKTDLVWQDKDTLVVATDWGEGSLTTSGYPFVVKRWKRGTPLGEAKEVFRGKREEVGVSPFNLEGAGGTQFLGISDAQTFFTALYLALTPSGVAPMTLPPKATPRGLFRNELLFTIEQDWEIGGHKWATGSLLSMPQSEVTSANPPVRLVLAPGPRDSVEEVAVTRGGVLVAKYSNVRGQLVRYTFDGKKWEAARLPLNDTGAVGIASADVDEDMAYATYTDFLQPTTLYSTNVATQKVAPIKSMPAKFDAGKYVTDQFEATSKDGTKVPYFVVRSRSLKLEGNAPTLLYGYGGFLVSMTPSYSATVGQLWLDQGGVYVLANIRGGGEFGPAWHDAGLKTHRQVVYDDFIAVAENLIQRKITSPRRLGIQGGSNGGLLMGVMLTQRPELFRAVNVQVPLLDMLRYNQLLAGASWMDEYGSPDVPEERTWLEKFSPYQNLVKRADFPLPFIETSTKDDRVHPGHARK
ncbi:MAG TPA: prolyl oligopeptidase family serine peptidase, partial [Steroidobacteraceae bacterium]|nr:prolyl oligopeptidase family serine peptidase [Steroidobacteraceae bacterium]